MRHCFRLSAAFAAYSSLPALAFGLALKGWGGPAAAVLWLNLLVMIGLLVVFSTFPVPAPPGTLARMDFAAIAWLPHVAVTRLNDGTVQAAAVGRWRRRALLATILLVLLPLPAVWAVVESRGPLGIAGPSSLLALLLSSYLAWAYWARERRAASRPLAVGTDIG